MLIDLQQITIPPGDRLLLNKITWPQYEQILVELGEYRSTKVAYSQGLLEIMTPLFSHENAKVVIGDFVKILLEELNLDYEP
ncbi:MAG: Uma2 family endonuclease, partial [Spirulinaceae cyanobacterium]